MIVKDEFLSRLRKIFDLNLYEVKVWTALLSRGTSTAGELSSISDVPRSRTYDILESLDKKGFVVMKLGKPIKFVALKPDEVIERVKRNLVKNAQEKTKRLETLKNDEVLEELNTLFTKGIKFVEPSDLSGSLKGRQNLYNHLDMMIRNAEKSVVIVTTKEGLNRKIEALLPSLEKCKKKKDEVVKEVSNLFKDLKLKKYTKKHEFDKSGRSKQIISVWFFNSGDHVRVECTVWSKKIKTKHGFSDNMSIVIIKNEVEDWIHGGYK